MSVREIQLAMNLSAAICRNYSANLREDHPDWADVALECAKMIEEQVTDIEPDTDASREV